jgi:hypothetical protein
LVTSAIRFLDYGFDPDLGNRFDGLIQLDPMRLKPAPRVRHLGAEQPRKVTTA